MMEKGRVRLQNAMILEDDDFLESCERSLVSERSYTTSLNYMIRIKRSKTTKSLLTRLNISLIATQTAPVPLCTKAHGSLGVHRELVD